MQTLVPTIKGLIPAIDRRKVQAPFVVEGKNFLMSVDGPVSGLGRRITGYETIAGPTNVQSFSIIETQESYVCTDEGIFRFNTESEQLHPLYLLAASVTAEFPWSHAFVGNKVYFTRPGVGLIEYDITADSWALLSGGSIPTDIYACTEAEGRLILLTGLVNAWSAIGDGQDFTPSTVTGAGSQALTKLGRASPRPLGVQKVADGYLTFLSTGIMKSQAIQSANPFRHTVLSKEHKAINPYCIILQDDEKVIFATLGGLFETTGSTPKLYSPLFSEFLHEKIFPQLDTVNNQNSVRLYATFERAWFIVSLAINQRDYAYDIAYLLNLRTDEWGSLNFGHTAFLDIKTLRTNQQGFNFSLLTADGTISRFDSSVGVETVQAVSAGLFYRKIVVDIPARINDSVTYFTLDADFRTVSTAGMEVSGLYDVYTEVGVYSSTITGAAENEDAHWKNGGRIHECKLYDNVLGTVEDVEWTDKVGTFVAVDEDNDLIASDPVPWDNGAASVQSVAGDAVVEHVIADPFYTLASETVVGFSSTNVDETQLTIEYGLHAAILSVGFFKFPRAEVIESGVTVWTGSPGDYAANSIFRIERIGTQIRYLIDGAVVYSSAAPSTGLLLVDVAIQDDSFFAFETRIKHRFNFVLLGSQQQTAQFDPLDAQVTVGSFRLFDEQTSDRLSFMSLLTVNMLYDAVGSEYEDWADIVQFPVTYEEDWLAAAAKEIDWGGDPTLITQYTASVLSSLDSYTPDESQDSELYLAHEDGKAKMFSCYSTGLYHQVQINALELGDNFDLKTLDATLKFSGRK